LRWHSRLTSQAGLAIEEGSQLLVGPANDQDSSVEPGQIVFMAA
jgi:hypothetical protein